MGHVHRRCAMCQARCTGRVCATCRLDQVQTPLAPCARCGAPLHRKTTPRADRAPGSKFFSAYGRCTGCVKRDGREGIIHRTTRGPQMVSVALPRIIVSSALSMTERARAACRVLDPEIWFQGDSPADVARAKAVCDTCPIRSRCLEVAVQNNERFGIFGGLTVPERMSLRAERRKAAS